MGKTALDTDLGNGLLARLDTGIHVGVNQLFCFCYMCMYTTRTYVRMIELESWAHDAQRPRRLDGL